MKYDLSKNYGLICVYFANADSAEGAVFSLLRNLQRCFSVSLDFYERMKSRYPSVIAIAAELSRDEKRLLDMILIKNEVVNRLNDQFKLINYGIGNYDPLNRTVNLVSLGWNRDTATGSAKGNESNPTAADGNGFLQTLKLLGLSIGDGPVAIKIDAIRAEVEERLGPVAAGRMSHLISLAHEIEDLISGLDEDSYEKLELLAAEHREIFDLDKKIGAIQTDCSDILRMIIEGRSFHNIPTLVEYLEIYNTASPHRLVIGSQNRLLPVFPIEEHEYVAADGIQGWPDAVKKMIAYSVIEFLKSEKSRRYLKECRTCSKYFMARQPKTQKYCSRQCRLAWPKVQRQAAGQQY